MAARVSIEPAAAGVDQHRALAQQPERVVVHQVMRVRRQRTVQRHDVALGEQRLDGGVGGAERRHGRRGKRIAGEDAAAEAGQQPHDHLADLAGADDAGGLAVHVEADQAVEGEVAVADAGDGARDVAVEREDQRDRVLGDRVRRIGGDAHDADAELGGGGEIDLVEAGAAQRDEAGAALRELAEDGGVEVIVDEGRDDLEAAGQLAGGGVEVGLEVDQLVAGPHVGAVEVRAVVEPRAEDRDAHATSP